MGSLDWLKLVLVLTLTAFPAFHASSQPSVIIALVSPYFRVLFPSPGLLHLAFQTEQERGRQN